MCPCYGPLFGAQSAREKGDRNMGAGNVSFNYELGLALKLDLV